MSLINASPSLNGYVLFFFFLSISLSHLSAAQLVINVKNQVLYILIYNLFRKRNIFSCHREVTSSKKLYHQILQKM